MPEMVESLHSNTAFIYTHSHNSCSVCPARQVGPARSANSRPAAGPNRTDRPTPRKATDDHIIRRTPDVQPRRDSRGALVNADFYRALADHLDAHPHLAPVNVDRATPGIDLQLVSPSGPADLAAWAESFRVTELTVRRPGDGADGWCHVDATTELAGTTTRVWTAVPELADHHHPPGSTVTVGELRALPGGRT